MIRSHRTFYYGYYEARVFLPNAKGVWPAFWLEADYDADGKTWHPPEIDIFEYVINGVEDKANSLHSNTVGPWNEKSYTHVDKNFMLKFQNMYASEDLNQGWHTAGFVWAPDRISMFWDGRCHLHANVSMAPPGRPAWTSCPRRSQFRRRRCLGRSARNDEAAFPQAFKVRLCSGSASSQILIKERVSVARAK